MTAMRSKHVTKSFTYVTNLSEESLIIPFETCMGNIDHSEYLFLGEAGSLRGDWSAWLDWLVTFFELKRKTVNET